ncbi:MAG TPA: T9SS type A sorting domain-containing protein, partial [Saprospiraceae bacterium]|nr:T9SS type A sorting domain-containing protein [Saprospiraceae bacterium]
SGINQVANRPIPMSVFPNPAKEAIDIRFDLDKGGEVEMNLSTLAGNNILNLGKSVYGAGANTRKVNLPSNIAAGNYLLTLRTASQVSSYLLNVR